MAGIKGQAGDGATEVLKDILIVQLGLAKVPQQRIQQIVGCSINRVNGIAEAECEGGQRRMKRNGTQPEPIVERLDEIVNVLRDLLIIECARTGMTRADLRSIVGVDNNRISRIARHVKRSTREAVEN